MIHPRHILKVLLFALAGTLLAALLAGLALRIALARVPQYQAQIQDWLKRETGYPMRFAHVWPTFRWSGPELYLDQLELRSKDGTRVLAQAVGGRVSADPWQLLHGGRLFALRIELESPSITLRRVGAHAFALAPDLVLGADTGAARALGDWPDGTLSIRRGRLVLLDWNEQLPVLELDRLDLDVSHHAALLESRLAAHLPALLGGRLEIQATVRGAGPASTLAWQTSTSARDVAFAGWRTLLPEYLTRLNGGTGAFDLSISGSGPVLAHAELNFSAHAVTAQLMESERLGSRGASPQTAFDEVGGVLTVEHAGDHWSMHGRHLRALVPGRHDPESQFDATLRGGESGLLELEASANYLRAATLLPLAGLMPQRELRERLREIAPTGEWMDMHVLLARARPEAPWKLDCQARFRDVGFAPLGRAPGLRGLSGSLAGTELGGHVVIDGPAAVLDWPGQLSASLPLAHLATTLYWQRTADHFLVATPSLRFVTHGAAVAVKGAWSSPSDGGSPTLSIAGGLEGGEAAEARFFFPHEQLPTPVLDWLDRAFVKGHVAHADLVFTGPVRHFPFRDGSGVFLIRALIDGLTLDYREGWPRIEDLAVLAEFRNEGMDVRIQSARAAGLQVTAGEARFADFRTGELQVEAQAQGDAADALGFLAASPLDAMADHGFSATQAHGALRSHLKLFLPFRDFDQRRILVHLDLKGVSAAPAGVSTGASELSGEADIEGARVTHANLHGTLLGGPFSMSARRNRTRTVLDARGTLAGEALRAALGAPSAVHIGGDSDWHAVLRVAAEPGRERSLHVTSSLMGLDLGLPVPLDKRAGAALPLSLDLQWPSSSALQVRLGLGTLFDGTALFESEPAGWRLARAAVGLGTSQPGFSDSQTLSLAGHLERLDLGGWSRLASTSASGRPVGGYLSSSTVEVDELEDLGLVFRHITLSIAALEGGWRIGVSGPDAAGTITLPADPAAPLTVEFARLRAYEPVPGTAASAETETAGARLDPRTLPAINFHVADLALEKYSFGEVRAALTRLEDGVVLKQLTVESPVLHGRASGEWRTRDAGTAHINGRLTSSDVAAALQQLGFGPVIEAKSGSIDFDLRWLGAPTSASLEAASGTLKLALEKGQIVRLDPGAGRVLGLASLTELPRRLAFDFSDLTDKGFAFDTIRGDYILKDGSATTDDLIVRGPAAEIGLVGRVGLKSKDLDQTAVVTGNVGSSPLPLAAFAGGPVVGAAVVLFTQMFKQPLKGLVRGYYRITGPWDNPAVERIKSADAAQATAETPKP